jgi:hypothetical protein
MADNLGFGELSAAQERLLDLVATEVRDHLEDYREAGKELDRRFSVQVLRKERGGEIRRTANAATRLEKAARAIINEPGYRHIRTAANLLKARTVLLVAWLLGDPEAGDCRLAGGAMLTGFQAIPWEFEPDSTPMGLLKSPESREGKAALTKFGDCRLGVRVAAFEADDHWGNDPKWAKLITSTLRFVHGIEVDLPAGPTIPPVMQFTPTDADLRILVALEKRKTRTVATFLNVPGVGVKVMAARLRSLEEAGLVDRNEGPRKGWAISTRGRELCASSAPTKRP